VLIPEQRDPEMIATTCNIVAGEDADNGGVRADGKPWDLDDLVIDTPAFTIAIAKFHDAALVRGGAVLRDALAAERSDETIEQLCAAGGHPIATSNVVKDETVGDALAALRHSIRLDD